MITLSVGVMAWTNVEAYLMRQASERIRIESFRPVLTFTMEEGTKRFVVKNIGLGPALDVELRISRIHPQGGFTNLQNVLQSDQSRILLNLGQGEQWALPDLPIISKYATYNQGDFSHGVVGVFALIATYEDPTQESLLHRHGYSRDPRLDKRSAGLRREDYKAGHYDNGELPKLVVVDWLK